MAMQTTDLDARMQNIQDLQQQGVSVAQGTGSVWQKMIVHFCQILCGGVAVHYFLANPLLLISLPLVCVLIDFLSGFVHWFFDNQVRPGPTPLGRIAVDFLDHHIRPARTVGVSFVVSAYRPAIFVALPLVGMSLMLSDFLFLQVFVFWVGSLSLYIPQTHKLAHRKSPGSTIRWCQRRRLIIDPVSHGRHHSDNNESFCVFTGWLNPPLDSLRFWRGLEWLFSIFRRTSV